MKYLVNLDLNQNEIQNAVIQPLATAPSNPVLGQVYFNTTNDKLYQYDGSAWVCVGVTYDMEAGTVSNNSVPITLTGSDGTTDTVNIKGAGGATITKSGNTITITTSTGSITDVQANGTSVVSNGVANIPLATASSEGLMSGADKTLLADMYTSKAPIASPTFTGTPLAPLADGTIDRQIANVEFVQDSISDALAASDAMRFKGTIGTGGTVTTLPTTDVLIGDTYRVITAGTYGGHVCEIGDLIIAIDTTPEWTVAQTNIDGAITQLIGTSPISVANTSGSTKTIGMESSGVTPGDYGLTNDSKTATVYIPTFSVDSYGRITSVDMTSGYILSASPSNNGLLTSYYYVEFLIGSCSRPRQYSAIINSEDIQVGSNTATIGITYSSGLTISGCIKYLAIDSLHAYTSDEDGALDEILVDWDISSEPGYKMGASRYVGDVVITASFNAQSNSSIFNYESLIFVANAHFEYTRSGM